MTGPTARLTVANVGSHLLSFVGGVIIARVLGPVGRGQVSLVQVYDDVSSNVLSAGTPQATGYLAKERVASEAEVLGAALKISMVSLPLTVLIGWVVERVAFDGFPTGVRIAAWMAIGMTPLANAFTRSCAMILAARGDIAALVPLQIAQMAARVGVLLLLAALDVFTATTAAFTVIVVAWLAGGLAWRSVRVRPRGGGPIRPMLSYGFKTIPGSLANMTNARLDQILIAPVLSTAALGVYAVAVAVNVIPVAVGAAIALAGYHKVRGTPAASAGGERLLGNAVIVVTACSLATVVGIVALLVPVYGDRYHEAVVPALILVPGSAAMAMYSVVAAVGNAIGNPALAGWAQGSALIVTVVGLPILLPLLEIDGAALVSTASYFVRLAVGLWLLRRRGVKLGVRDLPPFRRG